jgi:hypothetical protein
LSAHRSEQRRAVTERTTLLSELDEGLPGSYLDCGSSTYSRLLRQYELDARILGDDWCYRYTPGPALWAVQRLSAYPRTRGTAIRAWYGIEERVTRHDTSSAAWKYIRSVVADGRKVVVGVDLCAWPRSSFYDRHHYPHRVLIADCRDGEALVVDGRGDSRYVQWIAVTEIDRAMNTPGLTSILGDFDDRNVTIDLPRPGRGRGQPDPEQIRRALSANLHTWHGLDSPAPAGATDPAGGVGEEAGWLAVQRFRDDLRTYAETVDEFPDILVVPGVAFLGGLMSQRKFNALFLALAQDTLGLDLGRATAAFEEIARQWEKMFYIFLYGYHAGRPMVPLLRRLVDRVFAVTDLEHRLMLGLLHRFTDSTGGLTWANQPSTPSRSLTTTTSTSTPTGSPTRVATPRRT